MDSINSSICVSQTETVEEPIEDEAEADKEETTEDEAEVEEEDEDKDKPKTKKVMHMQINPSSNYFIYISQ